MAIATGYEQWCPNMAEKAMAPHSSTLAWKIPWTEEPGRLQSMRSLRVRHDWSDLAAADLTRGDVLYFSHSLPLSLTPNTRLGITTVYHLTPGLLDFCYLPGSDVFWSLQSLEYLVLTHSQTAEVHFVQSRGRGMRREWFHGQMRNCESSFPSQSLLSC